MIRPWAEDEARPGLKPIARRVWAVRGRRPTAHGRAKYQWLYVYGLVHPASGTNLELILPAADTDWMGAALAAFARWADPVGENHVRCIMLGSDGARLKGIAFRSAGTPLGQALIQARGAAIHIAGHLRADSWQGRDETQLFIEDAAPAL